jgi:hypothetical protein
LQLCKIYGWIISGNTIFYYKISNSTEITISPVIDEMRGCNREKHIMQGFNCSNIFLSSAFVFRGVITSDEKKEDKKNC